MTQVIEAIQSVLPDPLSLGGLGTYGGAGVGFVVLRSARRWYNATKTPSRLPAPSVLDGPSGLLSRACRDTKQHVTATCKRPPKYNVKLTLPKGFPLTEAARRLTQADLAASSAGLVAGWGIAWLYANGSTEWASGMGLVFVFGALAYRYVRNRGVKTVHHEHWWGLVALAVGAGTGLRILGGGFPI